MCLSFPRGVCEPRESFRGPCVQATMGESSFPRRDGVGRARGGCLRENGDGAAAWRCAHVHLGMPGGGAVR